jgi:hypothetical protein
MLALFRSIGLTPDMFYAASIGSMLLSVLMWFIPRSGDKKDQSRPERLAIFVGLWPPTLFLMGHALREDGKLLDDEGGQAPFMQEAMKQERPHVPPVPAAVES